MNTGWRSEKGFGELNFNTILRVSQDFHRHKRECISLEVIKGTSGEETAWANAGEVSMCRVFGEVHS